MSHGPLNKHTFTEIRDIYKSGNLEHIIMLGFPSDTVVKNLLASSGDTETWVQSLGWEDLLEKEMAICSSILAWEILWTKEPRGLLFIEAQRVRHD